MIEFNMAILLGPAFFRTGGLSPGVGGMPLHDAVVINCEKATTTENQGAGAWYMGQEVCWTILWA